MFEPHVAPMPIPLPAPRAPLGFPPRAAPAPSTPQITTAGGPTGCQGSQTAPNTEASDQTAPYTEAGGPTPWGPSTAPATSPGVGPPPRAWPTSPITYTHRSRQPATPSPVTPPRRPSTVVLVTPPVNPHPMVTRAKYVF
jgi:hypothetical protein